VGREKLSDLDAANTSMFNLMANSKTRVQQRQAKQMTIHREYQEDRTAAQGQQDIYARLEAENRRLDALDRSQNPQGPKLLGGGQARRKDLTFEDDDGEQEARLQADDEVLAQASDMIGQARRNFQLSSFMLDDQNKLTTEMSEMVSLHTISYLAGY